MIKASDIIHLSPKAFWDVDMTALDFGKQSDYIIRKVFEHGSWDDILEVTAYYGNEKTATALVNADYLMEKTMILASKIFTVPITNFKCFTTKQYHPVC
jgi:hypothetical protein